MSAGWAKPSSRGLWDGDALLPLGTETLSVCLRVEVVSAQPGGGGADIHFELLPSTRCRAAPEQRRAGRRSEHWLGASSTPRGPREWQLLSISLNPGRLKLHSPCPKPEANPVRYPTPASLRSDDMHEGRGGLRGARARHLHGAGGEPLPHRDHQPRVRSAREGTQLWRV